MCGKFTAQMEWGEYVVLAGVGLDGGHGGKPVMDAKKMLGTFTPMAMVPVMHLGPVRQRRISPMRWGWYEPKDATRRFSHLHARSEEIEQKRTWRGPFLETRGVIFSKQFNIGEELPNGKTRQWICSRKDAKPVAIAVIYSAWELVQGPLRAFVMVTTESCAPLNAKDNRMPALLRDDDEIAMWLGESGASEADLKALLRPYDGELVMREQDPPKNKQDGPPARPKKPEPQPGLF
jgi:putative SOS response-associated peptidase YedK